MALIERRVNAGYGTTTIVEFTQEEMAYFEKNLPEYIINAAGRVLAEDWLKENKDMAKVLITPENVARHAEEKAGEHIQEALSKKISDILK